MTFLKALRYTVETEQMAILTLPRFVEELQAYAALQLLRRLLVDNQGLCRDGGLWGTVGVKELRGQYPNIGHALECILLMCVVFEILLLRFRCSCVT